MNCHRQLTARNGNAWNLPAATADRGMNWLLAALMCVAGCTDVVAAAEGRTDQVRKQAESTSPHDRVTFVILAPGGPVFADLRIAVAKQPYRAWLGAFLAKQLDTDRSGSLTNDELAVMTGRLRTLLGIGEATTSIVRLIATDSDAAAIDGKEFANWIREHLPRSFFISAVPKTPDDSVRLTSMIDLNQDDAVSDDELQAAMHTLRLRDLDDDQTFSISELLPYRDPRNQDASLSPEAASLPFLEITDEASAERASARLMNRYGRSDTGSDVKFLMWDQLRFPENAPAPAPAPAPGIGVDREQRLDEEQLRSFLNVPQFHLSIDVGLSDLANNSDVAITVTEAAQSFVAVSRVAFGTQKIVLDGMPLTVTARGGGANNRAVTRGFLGQSFTMYDGDRNQYLDESEFVNFATALDQSGVAADFAAVDADHNKMIVRDEIYKFVERESIAVNSRIEVTVEQEGRTLFSLLDSNADRRLTSREFRDGFRKLKNHDATGDDRFAESELGTEFLLIIGLGRSEARRNNSPGVAMMNGNMRQTDAILPGTASGDGPEWFRRMDRNQDGDVNRREFLGTAAMFAETDLDGDGLISADEATALERRE